ncbi:hypothetical protein OSTOST_07557, partial [Ostertagia ostertagi]
MDMVWPRLTVSFMRYDPRRNQWTSVASMGEERYGHSVSVLNGCLYAVGGWIKSSVERLVNV